MNALEHQLSYPFGDTLPETGTTLELLPGIRWVRMALPFALDHINLWLLRDQLDGPEGKRDGWTIVDCGISNAGTQAAWEQVFANELGGLPVLRVIVTHLHPDHVGLASWLTKKWSTPDHECRLWMSATDFNAARMASSATAGTGVISPTFAASHGITDAETLEKLDGRSGHYADLVPEVPNRYRRLIGGDVVRIGGHDWVCHTGYGHAPEHISLHSASQGVLISGDMVLPRISTNVGVSESEPEGNPLLRYLESVERMRALPADTLVLPSHGKPFRGLHTRIDQLKSHHDDRFAEVLQACAEAPHSAADMLMVLFKRKLDLHQTTFAMGESIAHLNALWLANKLSRKLGSDGVYRFSMASAAP
jgi:glyoxylase-like metal-dependent hydrolase (beta-lactamase superfamily II)